jgi:hypothetical protein
VTDTAGGGERPKVSLGKAFAGSRKPPMARRDEWPPSLRLAVIAVAAQILLSLLRGVAVFGYTASLRAQEIKVNKDAGKSTKILCSVSAKKGCLDVASEVHTYQLQVLLYGVLVSVLVAMTVMSILRRGRSGRALYLAVTLASGLLAGYAGSPVSLLAVISGGPVVLAAITALAAAASIVAMVMLYRPDMKAFLNPSGAPARPGGLGALFGPRPPRRPRPGAAPAAEPVVKAVPAEAPRARAKVRSDNDAVAKGAELARSRAKASKSRRSDS